MSQRIQNTVSWAAVSAAPTARLLHYPSAQIIRKARLLSLTVNSRHFYQIMLLLRHGSLFVPAQLVELFCTHLVSVNKITTWYSFFLSKLSLMFSCLFTPPTAYSDTSYVSIPSSDFFFEAAWWLEREGSEMTGLLFTEKSDSRNLLLEYTNAYKPMVRAFPSFGFFEIIFNSFLRVLEVRSLGLQQS